MRPSSTSDPDPSQTSLTGHASIEYILFIIIISVLARGPAQKAFRGPLHGLFTWHGFFECEFSVLFYCVFFFTWLQKSLCSSESPVGPLHGLHLGTLENSILVPRIAFSEGVASVFQRGSATPVRFVNSCDHGPKIYGMQL